MAIQCQYDLEAHLGHKIASDYLAISLNKGLNTVIPSTRQTPWFCFDPAIRGAFEKYLAWHYNSTMH